MFNFSPEKLFLVGIIALLVLGPHRLPNAARSLGRLLAQLRHMSSSFQEEVRGALSEPVDAFNSAVGDLRPPQDLRRSVRDVITNTLTPTPPSSSTPPAPPGTNGPASTNSPVANNTPVSPDLPVAPDDPALN
jgi:sec-independent protein translocase protein TatB